jgi:hypothetical protein
MPVAFPVDGNVQFARDVEPILQQTCLDCHGPAKHRASLRLDTKDAALKGGAHGPSLVPGKSGDSLLMKHVLALEGKKRMPMGHDPLTDAQTKILAAWIDKGADWPTGSASIASNEQKVHWAYVKPVRAGDPGRERPGLAEECDRLFRIEPSREEGIKPSPEADRTTLIRRVSLDHVGLPPSP